MWSRKWDYCQGCESTDRKHYALGRCYSCYVRMPEHAERLRGRHQKYPELHKQAIARFKQKNPVKFFENQVRYWTRKLEEARAV